MRSLAQYHRRLVNQGPDSRCEKLIELTLDPLGRLYGTALWFRALLYKRKVFSSYRPKVPVISVGNLSVGGTGKTPMTDHLVKFLLDQGKKVAVVSRGYGGRKKVGVNVVSQGRGPLVPAEDCGDEPFLLAQRNPGAMVFTSVRRAEGIQVAVERFGAEIIILDDGFQHLAVQRDFDIVLLDARKPLGNGKVLPAGLLREFPQALKRCDCVVFTRSAGEESLPPELSRPVFHSRHRLADQARSLGGEAICLEQLNGKKGVAFAGIADPQGFFDALAESGLTLVETVALSDHAAYNEAVLGRLRDAVRKADFLVTTEKDGVKLGSESFSVPCYQVPMALDFFQKGALESLIGQLIEEGTHMPLSKELLEILACPKCKGEIQSNPEKRTILCDRCRLAYPVRDGIPVMLIDEAEPF